jgi:hypothetical protein
LNAPTIHGNATMDKSNPCAIPIEPSNDASARTPGRNAPSATKPLDSTNLCDIWTLWILEEPKNRATITFVAAKSPPHLSMAIVESHLVLDCPRAKSACSLFKRAALLPRRCVDLRTTNSGCNMTVSSFGAPHLSETARSGAICRPLSRGNGALRRPSSRPTDPLE